jgi:ABC-2 type transport system ATP-binding protein
LSILQVNGLVKKFGLQIAVDDVSFKIHKGEIVGFLGPNGAGKSTTMKMIAGILKPESGSIFINDKSAVTNELESKKAVAYLPEQNPLYPDLYVKEALEFSAAVHQIDRRTARIKEVIEACGLENEKNKKIQALSKGYKQRVGLAQAILHQPDLYILDEATTGLDPNQIVEIRDLIKSIGKDHAVLISTHILQEVESICQRCIVINKGKIMADDDIHSLKMKASGMPTVKVCFGQPVHIESLLSKWKKVTKLDQSNTYLISDQNADLSKSIFRWAAQNNIILEELIKEKQNIEGVFQILTSN